MKVKVGVFQAGQEALSKILTLELPVKAAFRLGRLYKAAQDVLKGAEEQRITLIKKYGAETVEGDMTVPEENMEKFSLEFTEVLDEEVEVDFEPLSLEELGDIKLKAIEMVALDPFFKE